MVWQFGCLFCVYPWAISAGCSRRHASCGQYSIWQLGRFSQRLVKASLAQLIELWGYIRVILGLYWGYIRVILGLYWGYIRVILGLYWGYIGVMYWDTGKENGSYYLRSKLDAGGGGSRGTHD